MSTVMAEALARALPPEEHKRVALPSTSTKKSPTTHASSLDRREEELKVELARKKRELQETEQRLAAVREKKRLSVPEIQVRNSGGLLLSGLSFREIETSAEMITDFVINGGLRLLLRVSQLDASYAMPEPKTSSVPCSCGGSNDNCCRCNGSGSLREVTR